MRAEKLMSPLGPRGVCLNPTSPQSHKVHKSVNSYRLKVKSPGPGHNLCSWQLCLKIILINLICEVYIEHCQIKLFMAHVFTCVLLPECISKPVMLQLLYREYLIAMKWSFLLQLNNRGKGKMKRTPIACHKQLPYYTIALIGNR